MVVLLLDPAIMNLRLFLSFQKYEKENKHMHSKIKVMRDNQLTKWWGKAFRPKRFLKNEEGKMESHTNYWQRQNI